MGGKVEEKRGRTRAEMQSEKTKGERKGTCVGLDTLAKDGEGLIYGNLGW